MDRDEMKRCSAGYTIEQDVHGLSAREVGVLRRILKAHQVVEFGEHPCITIFEDSIHIDGELSRQELAALDVFMAVRHNDSTIRA